MTRGAVVGRVDMRGALVMARGAASQHLGVINARHPRKRARGVARVAAIRRRDVTNFLTRGRGSVVARHARLGHRAVVHQGGHLKIRGRTMTGVAGCGRWNMSRGLAERDRAIVAAVARLRCAFENTLGVARFTGNKFMRTGQQITGRQVVEIEAVLRNRRAVRVHRTRKQQRN